MQEHQCIRCGRALTDAEVWSGVSTCATCAGSASEASSTPAEETSLSGQPPQGETSVNLRVDYPERLSRWLLFVKWLFVIPAYIVLFFYGIAVFVTTFISFWAILFTGRYPGGLFNFAAGYMALYAQTAAYFPLLLTDQYPLRSNDVESAVYYEIEEPEELSRGLLFLKLLTLLLGIVGTLTMVVAWFLILFVAIPVWFVILFAGRFPKGMFNFVVALVQWAARVTAWQWLLRDEWSLFATTRPVAYLVGVGAVAAVGLTITNYATGGFAFEFETGEDQNRVTFTQDPLETPAPTAGEEDEDGVTPAAATDLIETPAATPAAAPEIAAATRTFSKYGFSFDYPKEFAVSVVGLLENEANDTSGVVQVGLESAEEGRFFTVSWLKTVTLIGDPLKDSLEGGFQGLEGSVGIARVDRGEFVETEKEGQRLLYQLFTATDIAGDQGHGIMAAFYCEDTQKLFSFNIIDTTAGTRQDILQHFETYLDSFAC